MMDTYNLLRYSAAFLPCFTSSLRRCYGANEIIISNFNVTDAMIMMACMVRFLLFAASWSLMNSLTPLRLPPIETLISGASDIDMRGREEQ